MSFLAVVLLTTSLVSAKADEAAVRIYANEADPVPHGKIDEIVFAQLKKLGIQPAGLCSDAVFVRRVYLDVTGTLPTAEEARAFIENPGPYKRHVLIDRLLERDEFADYWALKWCDLLRVKAEFPINLWPNAAQAYHHWIRTSIRENMPYNQFVREMLTANGSNFRVGPVNFYRAMQNRTPPGIAQTVALTFMGMRTNTWSPQRLANMAAFFTKLTYKGTAEWKEEIVSFDPSKKVDSSAGPVSAVAKFPDGTIAHIAPGQDPRKVFADWLITPENPWFTRNIANRVWAWLLGRGIIQEPDDIRPDNPPSNPQLLAFLERALIENHYDMKRLYRLILNSTTYQLSSVPRSEDAEAVAAHFAAYPVRRLDAEVLIDALNQITGTSEQYFSAIPEPYTYIPEGQRAITLPDGSITSAFLEQFGHPARDTGLESERSNRPTTDQWLHLLNSSHIQRKIEGPKLLALLKSSTAQSSSGHSNKSGHSSHSSKSGKSVSERKAHSTESPRKPANKDKASDTTKSSKSSKSRIAKQLDKSSRTTNQHPSEIVDNIYLTILSRFPTGAEKLKVAKYFLSTTHKYDAAIDLLWVLINSDEFLYRH